MTISQQLVHRVKVEHGRGTVTIRAGRFNVEMPTMRATSPPSSLQTSFTTVGISGTPAVTTLPLLISSGCPQAGRAEAARPATRVHRLIGCQVADLRWDEARPECAAARLCCVFHRHAVAFKISNVHPLALSRDLLAGASFSCC